MTTPAAETQCYHSDTRRDGAHEQDFPLPPPELIHLTLAWTQGAISAFLCSSVLTQLILSTAHPSGPKASLLVQWKQKGREVTMSCCTHHTCCSCPSDLPWLHSPSSETNRLKCIARAEAAWKLPTLPYHGLQGRATLCCKQFSFGMLATYEPLGITTISIPINITTELWQLGEAPGDPISPDHPTISPCTLISPAPCAHQSPAVISSPSRREWGDTTGQVEKKERVLLEPGFTVWVFATRTLQRL